MSKLIYWVLFNFENDFGCVQSRPCNNLLQCKINLGTRLNRKYVLDFAMTPYEILYYYGTKYKTNITKQSCQTCMLLGG